MYSVCGLKRNFLQPRNTQGEEAANKEDCTRYVPRYILLKIRSLPEEQQAKIRAEEGAAADRYDRRMADSVKQLRVLWKEEQDERFQRYGLPRLRRIRRFFA